MKEAIVNFFGEYASLIVLFHVSSAVVWVGSMVFLAMLLSSLDSIENRASKSIEILGKFIKNITIAVVILIVTGALMAIGLGFKHGDPALYMIVHYKEGIWTVMTILFYMLHKRVKKYNSSDNQGIDELLAFTKKIVYASIALGLLAIYFGIKLRGF